MCGIWGLLILENNKYDNSLLYNKFNEIKNRGPDKSIYISNNNYIVGFHRLSIMDTSIQGDQPFSLSYFYHNDKNEKILRSIYVIVNGEIYNWEYLKAYVEDKNDRNGHDNYNYKSKSDCEVLLPLFLLYCYDDGIYNNSYNGIFESKLNDMINQIDGEFAFAIYDIHTNLQTNKIYQNLFLGRDRFGIRPLFYSLLDNKTVIFGSNVKSLNNINNNKVEIINPRSWYYFGNSLNNNLNTHSGVYYNINNLQINNYQNLEDIYKNIRNILTSSVIDRLQSDREICCLLSGGLDSSLISAIASRELNKYGKKLKTFSIGMENSTDSVYASIVSNHINSNHTNIIIPENECINAIEEVIKTIETYDITTIRATTYQYLISKWIKNNTNIKVVLIGDGSDELTGGYLYFHKAPSAIELDLECKRLLNDIHYYDVLRADRGIASNSLEARVPFLSHKFVNYYLQINPELRIPTEHTLFDGTTKKYEKYLLRKAFENTGLLPENVLFRVKEAFSDGVSSLTRSWYQIIQDKINLTMSDEYYETKKLIYNPMPISKEALYYREIYEKYYPNQGHLIPYYWMPKWIGSTDPSARTLNIYNAK
jgi:asparagine synthase (glutamine-hydrolysing)